MPNEELLEFKRQTAEGREVPIEEIPLHLQVHVLRLHIERLEHRIDNLENLADNGGLIGRLK